VASVIGAFYYLRIVYYMYFGADEGAIDERMAPMQWVVLMGSALIMVLGVINLFGIEGAAMAASAALGH
jgi:NADH-quinone oxidoreductase subunit N